ncbi:hypothetical protein MHBO_001734 [Bonamia ostreae]|uniref:Uncharacterized protein n=1 Tax=Bonamia ostreae TaxID=126728 RepID=A0ABV2AKJ2_9EUKA
MSVKRRNSDFKTQKKKVGKKLKSLNETSTAFKSSFIKTHQNLSLSKNSNSNQKPLDFLSSLAKQSPNFFSTQNSDQVSQYLFQIGPLLISSNSTVRSLCVKCLRPLLRRCLNFDKMNSKSLNNSIILLTSYIKSAMSTPSTDVRRDSIKFLFLFFEILGDLFVGFGGQSSVLDKQNLQIVNKKTFYKTIEDIDLFDFFPFIVLLFKEQIDNVTIKSIKSSNFDKQFKQKSGKILKVAILFIIKILKMVKKDKKSFIDRSVLANFNKKIVAVSDKILKLLNFCQIFADLLKNDFEIYCEIDVFDNIAICVDLICHVSDLYLNHLENLSYIKMLDIDLNILEVVRALFFNLKNVYPLLKKTGSKFMLMKAFRAFIKSKEAATLIGNEKLLKFSQNIKFGQIAQIERFCSDELKSYCNMANSQNSETIEFQKLIDSLLSFNKTVKNNILLIKNMLHETSDSELYWSFVCKILQKKKHEFLLISNFDKIFSKQIIANLTSSIENTAIKNTNIQILTIVNKLALSKFSKIDENFAKLAKIDNNEYLRIFENTNDFLVKIINLEYEKLSNCKISPNLLNNITNLAKSTLLSKKLIGEIQKIFLNKKPNFQIYKEHLFDSIMQNNNFNQIEQKTFFVLECLVTKNNFENDKICKFLLSKIDDLMENFAILVFQLLLKFTEKLISDDKFDYFNIFVINYCLNLIPREKIALLHCSDKVILQIEKINQMLWLNYTDSTKFGNKYLILSCWKKWPYLFGSLITKFHCKFCHKISEKFCQIEKFYELINEEEMEDNVSEHNITIRFLKGKLKK